MIRFQNVGLRYGHGSGNPARRFVRDATERRFQFLTGPSGAGKTTLLRLLFLSLKPTRGLINIFGRDRSRIARTGPAHSQAAHRRGVPGFPPARPYDDL
jgi:cell division transport system ATP-binding protein